MKPSAARLNSSFSGSMHASHAALFGSGCAGLPPCCFSRSRKTGLIFGVGQPALRPRFALGLDVVGLRRAVEVAEEAGVVRGAHALAAFGDQANERDVAGFQRARDSCGWQEGCRRISARSRCVPTIRRRVLSPVR